MQGNFCKPYGSHPESCLKKESTLKEIASQIVSFEYVKYPS